MTEQVAQCDLLARGGVCGRDFMVGRVSPLDPAVVAPLRLLAVGRRWGRRALPLLDELAARPNAPRALAVLAEGARQ